MKPSCNVATLIERYFTERLMRQRNVSANTIASYRDTFRLLFTFAQQPADFRQGCTRARHGQTREPQARARFPAPQAPR
jgi:site-specific recombinase XerD